MSSGCLPRYNQHQYVEPVQAEQSFRSTFDLEDPQNAASSYAKLMHKHTMMQLEAAARSASRRGSSAPSTGSLSSENSLESIDSNDL